MNAKYENNGVPRATGVLVIEASWSNPNGDPDMGGEPRQKRLDGRGKISDVSFKRKLRDLVEQKDGPVWQAVTADGGFPEDEFEILESRATDRTQAEKLVQRDFNAFSRQYWDARVFGNTVLPKEAAERTTRGGVAVFRMGYSVAPVHVELDSNTRASSSRGERDGKEGPNQGMAPQASALVEHGIYVMPFTINPTAAVKNGCTRRDVDLLLRVIPHAYTHTPSRARPSVHLLHAWYVEHTHRLGSCPEWEIIDTLSPKKKTDPDEPSRSREEYEIPASLGALGVRLQPLRDLVEEAWKSPLLTAPAAA